MNITAKISNSISESDGSQKRALQISFLKFIWQRKRNRRLLLIALGGAVVQFIIFKSLYPFADFFSDSYSYIYAAYAKLNINIWPIGYSWFLRYFHFITNSDTAVIALQYFFLQISALLFFFSILYFYTPNKTTTHIIFIFLFFNPLFLYICNYINSDPLFASLSLLWLTQLIWIIYRPMPYQILTQALLLVICFTIRNNGMYYPLVAALAFIVSKQRLIYKFSGIIVGSLFVILFINQQRNAAYKLIGKKEFSLFTGWQLANNALYIYNYIDVDSTKLSTSQARELNRLSDQFFRQVKPGFNEYLRYYVANFFIRQPEAPLKRYFKSHYIPQNEYNKIIAWGKASIIFDEFGSSIIKDHPVEYIQHFVLLNAKNYFIPPLEKLEVYNLGMNEVWPIAQYWFGYKTLTLKSISKSLQGKLLFLFPILFFFINICFLGTMVLMIIRKIFHRINLNTKKSLFVLTGFWLANFSFTILTTINVFRYQFIPLIVCLCMTLLLAELLDNKKTIIQIKEVYA